MTLVPIESLTPDPKNARKHNPRNIGQIEDSLQAVGAARSGVVDEKGRILAGNGMHEAAMGVGMRQAIIVDADGHTPVFVRRRGLTAKQKLQLAIADNRTQETSEWDAPTLRDLAEQMPDLKRGWSDKEWAALTARSGEAEPTAGLTDPDDVPSLRRTSIQLGDLFELGAHRLLCGDATKATDVARLMGDVRAGLMNTDPPYGVAYANEERPNPGVAKPRVANDTLSDARLQTFLETAFRAATSAALVENAAWYLWHAHLTQGFFAAAAAAAAANVVLHRQIIWVKPVLLLGRGQYHWKHEPCFMGWVQGHQPPDYGRGGGERDQTTVWEVESVTQAERKTFDHSTPKPVGLFTVPIVKHLRPSDVCYEPFAGSGPQFIAAHQMGRRCYGLEIEPRFCQVIIDRWEAFTGQRAKKVGAATSPRRKAAR